MAALLSDRWEYVHSPIHSVAYVLDPEFLDCEFTNEEVAFADFHKVVERLFDTLEEQSEVISDFQKYRAKEGLVGGALATACASQMPAHKWWQQFGCCWPNLQKLAVRILSQVLILHLF